MADVAAPGPGDDLLAFAEQVMELLARTNKTATYKFAVLLGLIDVCQAHFTREGVGPESVTTVQLADAVIALYWNQVRPFRDVRLVQIRGGAPGAKKIITDHIAEQRARAGELPFAHFRRERRAEYQQLVDRVEDTLIKYPLRLLQKLGNAQEVRFIYADFPTRTQNLIRFRPRAGDHLARLAGLLRPVIKRQWALWVSEVNGLADPGIGLDSALERHLFGAPRTDVTGVRAWLEAHQHGRCFYCEAPLVEPEVDHFIPWARVPLDAIENLVLADRRCNGNKSASLAATRHVARWSARLQADGAALAEAAEALAWESAHDRALGLARSIYLPITPEAMLWDGYGRFVRPDKPTLFQALA